MPQMKTLVLHGSLRREFGERFRVSVATPAQAIRLMDVNFPGKFRRAMEGKTFLMTTAPAVKSPGCRRLVTEERLLMSVGHDEIHLRPVAMGGIKGLFAGLGGAGAFGGFGGLFGLGGAGAAAEGGGLFGLGAGGAFGGIGPLLLGVTLLGIAMLLSKQEEPKDKEEKKSFLFDGPINTFEQGGPVPLVYGTVRTGSIVISGGLEVAQKK